MATLYFINDSFGRQSKCKIKSLTFGKQYHVVRTQQGIHHGSGIAYSGVWVINDNDKVKYYSAKRFANKTEYRNMILKDILDGINPR